MKPWFLRFSSGKAALVSSAFWFALSIGLVGSLKVVLAQFGLDSDAAHPLMLWQGVEEHGLAWLESWRFTQDNWLLSLLPLQFFGFLLFGPKVSVVVISGWCIYVASAVMASAIAWKIGAKRAAAPVFLALINLNLYAHQQGFVSSWHNISNLIGLSCILIAIDWIERQSGWHVLALVVLFTVGAVSDPWMLAAYNVPLMLVGLIHLILLSQDDRKMGLILLASAAVSIVATETKLFGLLYFIPAPHMSSTSQQAVVNNSLYLLKNIGRLFDITPFSLSNSLLSLILSLAAIVGILLYCILHAIRMRVDFDPRARLFLWTAFACCGAIVSAFVIRGEYADDQSARFLISVQYLIIITIGALSDRIWNSASSWYRSILTAVFCLFFASGLISNWHHIFGRGFEARETGVSGAAAFLKQNGLVYGYAPYWGASFEGGDWVEGWGANALTVETDFRLRVRPVIFSKKSGMLIFKEPRTGSSKSWYTPNDVPSDVREYFVVVTPDDEGCPDVTLCLVGLVKQFGQPVRLLERGNTKILVWDHKLIGYESPPIMVNKGVSYFFNEAGGLPNGKGWSTPETWGVWSDGDHASILIDVKMLKKGSIQMLVKGHAFLPQQNQSQEVDVRANGQPVGRIDFGPASNSGVWPIEIPESVIGNNSTIIEIEFLIRTPISPLEAGLSLDPRRLGIGLISLEFN